MSLSMKRKILFTCLVILPILLVSSCFLYPPEIRYKTWLEPVLFGSDTDYSIDQETNSLVYNLGASSIEARYMTDEELNTLFPAESSQGVYSTNPYTYGDWIDPDLGYTPNRFTVFEVTVHNRDFAKMRVDPVEAELITDQGEDFRSYTFSVAAAKYGNSFENYYRTIRGLSGNEYYRYEMRLGMVRGKNYGLDEIIFRGDSYSGLITFDPLRPAVERVSLILNDIVYRFDAFNRPADVTQATFNFERKIERIVVTDEMRRQEMEREKVRVRIEGPQQLVDARVNDVARSAFTVDEIITNNVSAMETCFMERYRRNEVDPGRMVVSFTIEEDGTISSQNVIEVIGINSENFMNCILDVIQGFKFDAIEDMPLEGSNIVKGPAEPVNVLYPLEFQIYISEE